MLLNLTTIDLTIPKGTLLAEFGSTCQIQAREKRVPSETTSFNTNKVFMFMSSMSFYRKLLGKRRKSLATDWVEGTIVGNHRNQHFCSASIRVAKCVFVHLLGSTCFILSRGSHPVKLAGFDSRVWRTCVKKPSFTPLDDDLRKNYSKSYSWIFQLPDMSWCFSGSGDFFNHGIGKLQ